MTKKNDSSLILFTSVLICILVILFTEFFIFIPRTKKIQPENGQGNTLSNTQFGELLKYFPTEVEILDCSDLANGKSLEANTTCIIKPGDVIQTYSPVKVWNYPKQTWETPPNNISGEKTLINQTEIQDIIHGPVLLNCPWGCTIGYP